MGEPRLKTSESGEWKETRISNICDRIGSGGTPNVEVEDFYQYGEIPFLNISDITNSNGHIYDTNKHITQRGLESSTAQMFPSGTLSLAMYASVGKVAVLEKEMSTSQAFYNMCFKDESTRDTLFYLFQRMSENNEWRELISRQTQANLNAEKLSNLPVLLPESKKERITISQTFSAMDKMIENAKKEFQRLKQVKKASLSVMFPQEGETKPRVRFKGFTDDWEQRKLGEICQVTMGQSPDGSTYSEEPSEYILVQGNADMQNGWVTPRVWTTQKTKTAQAGDLIMSVRAPAGAMGKTAYDVVLGRGVAGVKGNEFVYQSLVKMDANGYWKKLAAGSTFESINSDAVKNAVLMVPQNIDEQIEIGAYFSNLDHLITLHQREVLKLERVKSAMLSQMFAKSERALS